jgi:RNA polymerase sigma-70 factor (ECF subfamily)
VSCATPWDTDGELVTDPWDWDAARRWCLVVARRYASADDAEDIAQEAMLRAWRKRADCRAPDRPWGWLAAITHHEAVRRLGARRHDNETVAVTEAGMPDPAIEQAIDRLAVRRAAAELDERDRTIVLLHYWYDMTVASIADQTGIPSGTVKVKLSRARTKLLERLQP